jgi:hypothetical protein
VEVVYRRAYAIEPSAQVGGAWRSKGGAGELLRIRIERASLRVVLALWQSARHSLCRVLIPKAAEIFEWPRWEFRSHL